MQAEDEEEEERMWRELDMEELQVEEVDDVDMSSSDNESMGIRNVDDVTFATCLVNMDSNLGEVDDAQKSVPFLAGGAVLNLPMFYLEGVVVFPEATLCLRVTQSTFKASVERALNQVDAPNTIGVVHVHKDPDNEKLHFSSVGTTVEILQYRRLGDSSLNVLTRGQQRFRLWHRWIDVEGAPCAEVQIIEEDLPLRTPRDAFGQLASLVNFGNSSSSHQVLPDASHSEYACSEDEINSEHISETSFEDDLTPMELQMHHSAMKSCKRDDRSNESTSSDSSQFVCELGHKLKGYCTQNFGGSSGKNCNGRIRNDYSGIHHGYQPVVGRKPEVCERWKAWVAAESKLSCRASRSFWPHWVYRMYDSYGLAQRAAVKWKQIIGAPSLDGLAKKPDILSFYIASRIPITESLKQELLEIDGVSYRLRREIEFLECMDFVRCKTCQSVIAKRSEMLVMSRDGPLGVSMDLNGYVPQIMTFYKANGLALLGCPSEECSWFLGYAWTKSTCNACTSVMGCWHFLWKTEKLCDQFGGLVITFSYELYPDKSSNKEKRKRIQSSSEQDDEDNDEEVQADFAFFDPKSHDFSGVKMLLKNYLDDKEWDLSGFVDLILGQPTVGTVIKIEGDEDNTPYSIDHRCIMEIKEFLLQVCRKDVTRDLRVLLEKQAHNVGLLVSQHVVNLPPQLLPPLFDGLFDEVSWGTEDEPTKELQESFRFRYYILATKVYKHKNIDQKGTSKGSTDDPIIYIKPEDEIFHKLSSWSFSFALRTGQLVAQELRNYRLTGLVMAIKADKVQIFQKELHSLINGS
ncbi:hypothetical protein IFM89_011498 [Coptis chinensis]|uniref:Protein cereblon n=1 Tax=Coptis chinensis TaxID=261450 RepID=A0A835IBJ3_9MAGN|nr:hypothetical protein IFM89_011498 [Coptis chinensis]